MSITQTWGNKILFGWMQVAMLLAGLPLLGIIAAGRDPAPYLEMPPVTRYVEHAGFSWVWFCFFAVADLLLIGGLLWALRCGQRHNRQANERPNSAASLKNVTSAAVARQKKAKKRSSHRVITHLESKENKTSANALVSQHIGYFPWWGWTGMALCLVSWLMAWKRYTWFWLFQPHTFLPIWAGFILVVNALAVKRSGSCLLLRRPLRFLLLFPASAGFWWFFEYLNRFVQNWYYTGIEGMGPGEYSYYSSLAFATVLPGVLSMVDLLLTVPAIGKGLACRRPIHLPSSRWVVATCLLAACIGLAMIGIFPDQLFSLLWVSPLIIILSLQALAGQPTLLHQLRIGDWRPVVIPALAALVCGFFWEMWNYFSLARWTYTIPYVQRFHLFEMPILGFGGYLPFGLACFAVGGTVTDNLFKPAA